MCIKIRFDAVLIQGGDRTDIGVFEENFDKKFIIYLLDNISFWIPIIIGPRVISSFVMISRDRWFWIPVRIGLGIWFHVHFRFFSLSKSLAKSTQLQSSFFRKHPSERGSNECADAKQHTPPTGRAQLSILELSRSVIRVLRNLNMKNIFAAKLLYLQLANNYALFSGIRIFLGSKGFRFYEKCYIRMIHQ